MNNEEKILTLLEGLTSEVKDMNNRLTNVENDLKSVKDEVMEVKDDVKGVKLTLENKTNKNIQLLAEGHQGLVGRLWHLPEEVEEIKERTYIPCRRSYCRLISSPCRR